jgi:acyl-CoA reductase-like NAD-dependent aldehyde dehydrogenase
VEAAERAFAGWSGTPPAQRRRLLQRASELLMRRQSETAALVAEETGGTLGWDRFDVQLAAGMLAYYAGQAGAAAEEEREIPELVTHPAVRRISFTGSTRAGRIIAQTAARHLKRVLLELGGKAPLVVLADADLERAVAAASFGSFMHQGQICMSTERHRGVINGS